MFFPVGFLIRPALGDQFNVLFHLTWLRKSCAATGPRPAGARPDAGGPLRGIFLAAGIATASGLLAADTDFTAMSLDELGAIKVPVVYGASKHEQKVTEAPSSVTIITRDEIQKSGYRTLAEILNSVPGFYVRNDRNFSLLGIRGFGRPGSFNSKFQLLLDGHRINDGVTGRAWIDHGFAVEVDLIERVEVIRGPGSSLYGDSAFFGVINVITRRGRDVGGAEVSGGGGSLGSYAGRVSYGTQWSNGVAVVVAKGSRWAPAQAGAASESRSARPWIENVGCVVKESYRSWGLQGAER